MIDLTALARLIIDKTDIGHLGLLAWALGLSWLCLRLLKDLEAANSRFEAFVGELQRFNQRFNQRLNPEPTNGD